MTSVAKPKGHIPPLCTGALCDYANTAAVSRPLVGSFFPEKPGKNWVQGSHHCLGLESKVLDQLL
jgi:hypothetical protein